MCFPAPRRKSLVSTLNEQTRSMRQERGGSLFLQVQALLWVFITSVPVYLRRFAALLQLNGTDTACHGVLNAKKAREGRFQIPRSAFRRSPPLAAALAGFSEFHFL